MEQQELKEKVVKILEENKVGVLSSVQNDRPHARYMTFFNDGTTLYTATNGETEKVDEIESNPYVHVLLGYDGEGFGDSYVEVSGTSQVKDSPELKKKMWNDHLKPWFDGPEDPNYVILEIIPDSILLMNSKGEGPKKLEL
ncbi:pyridoxamine 5'-phosphate oxidase family protein [Actinomycetes bacterium NPDC127524]